MNLKKFYSLSFCVLLLSMLSTPSFAGFPINCSKATTVAVQKRAKVKQKLVKQSERKLKLANKVLVKKMDGDNKTAAIVFAILIPFVGVAIYQDRIGRDFWITLLLTVLLYVPGLIYALSIVLKRTH